ncbi:uncharacterized protein [Nicotiana sylvestris]|uniref:uncharacterized protein n=1 Tax=Nicotiana sylvestris TaxID=4096 RepID=UPI00388C65CB
MDQDISHWHIWDDLARDFIRQFQYNVDIAPNMNSLTNIKKKTMESFREYDIKLREQASTVKLPMDETEMVLDMDTSYNFLQGRPWIHAAGVVPSTLHQMVKFEHENQEIVVHGKDEQSIYRDPSVPCLEAKKGTEHIVYQAFEIVVADEYEEGALFPQPCLSNASKGARGISQGITEPITSTANEKFFGVGFQATNVDIKCADEHKKNGWVLPQPVPRLAKSFVKPKYVEKEEEEEEEEEEESFTAEEIEDICEAMKQILYESHMGPAEGRHEHCKVMYKGPNAKLQNWKATPFNVSRESRVMPFGLKNAGATYMRAMTAIFHDMMHQEIKVYVDDVIIKSRTQEDHVRGLRKFFECLCRYGLKLNPAKCAFGVPFGKLLEFIVSRRDSSLNSLQLQAHIQIVKERHDNQWTDESQEAFDKIKEYLSNPPVLVPHEPGRALFLYLTVLENSFGCVLGQHDVIGKRKQAIYYLSKKFTSYEAKYTLLERTCCALTWVAQKLRYYLLAYTTYLITRIDPLKYIFQKPMPTGRLAKWQILLTKFDIVYVTCMAMKAQALADHLAENPVNDKYQPLSTYFPNKEVNSVEVILEDTNAWKIFFDGAVNAKDVRIGAILILPTGQHYPAIARLRLFYMNNTPSMKLASWA